LFGGILGTYKQMMEGSLAYEFLIQQAKPVMTTEHAEAALREWIGQKDYKDVNKILGSFAQIFTQDMKTAKTQEAHSQCFKVVRALCECVHKP
jgi:endonuclease III